jgi:hypothetical protein
VPHYFEVVAGQAGVFDHFGRVFVACEGDELVVYPECGLAIG